MDLRKRLKFSTGPHTASLTFNKKNNNFRLIFFSFHFCSREEKVSWGFCVNLPPWVYSRWHCSMTEDNSHCYNSLQQNGILPPPPPPILKLKRFGLTMVSTPSPSYLKIKGSFIHYFHLISSSFQFFKNSKHSSINNLLKCMWNLTCQMYVNVPGRQHSTAQ